MLIFENNHNLAMLILTNVYFSIDKLAMLISINIHSSWPLICLKNYFTVRSSLLNMYFDMILSLTLNNAQVHQTQ